MNSIQPSLGVSGSIIASFHLPRVNLFLTTATVCVCALRAIDQDMNSLCMCSFS